MLLPRCLWRLSCTFVEHSSGTFLRQWRGLSLLVFVQWKRQGCRTFKFFGYLKNKKWRKKKSESTLVTKTCSKPSFLMLTKWNVQFLDYSQGPFKVNKNDLCFPSLLFLCNISAGITLLVSAIWMLMNVRASKEFVGFTIYFATCLNLRFSNSFNTPLFILEHKRMFVAWA